MNTETNIIKPFPGTQEQFLSCGSDIVIYGGSGGGGKGLALDTPIITNNGWKTMGDIEVGDVLFDDKGNQCRVTKAYPVRTGLRCYKLKFSTGEEIVCDQDHLWYVYSENKRARIRETSLESLARKREKWRLKNLGKIRIRPDVSGRNQRNRRFHEREIFGEVLNIEEMIRNIEKLKPKRRLTYTIKRIEPLKFSPRKLPIHPYILGLWLGKGCLETGYLDIRNHELLGALQQTGCSYSFVKGRKNKIKVKGLKEELKELGILSNRDIPDEYMYSPAEDRFEIIKGVFDIAGYSHGPCKGTACIFSEEIVAEKFRELLHSVGILPHKHYLKKIGDKYKYHVTIVKTTIPLFKLNSSYEKIQKGDGCDAINRWHYIKSITPVDSVPTRCIEVDSPMRLFVCGKTMIPTHNSFALLLDPLRYANCPGFNAVIFRRSTKDLTNAGSLWSHAMETYLPLGATVNKSNLTFRFPAYKQTKSGELKVIPDGGGVIQFSHMYEVDDRLSWQGSQVCYIGFDELTHFEYCQFEYLFSRNRNTKGFPNLIRGTCNPDPDSFVRQMLDPYINKETGFPIPEMIGKEIYLVIENGEFIFGNSKEELLADNPKRLPKSFTFIPSKITDNPYLRNDESYLASLNMLNEYEKSQLLDGCWSQRPSDSKVFKRDWFDIVDIPNLPRMKRKVRGWDLAASKDKNLSKSKKYDYTSSVKLEEGEDGYIYITDMTNEQLEPAEINNRLKYLAAKDGIETVIRLPQDPGSAGKHLVHYFSTQLLRNYVVHYRTMRSDKVSRANVVANKASQGLFRIVRGEWNKEFIKHLERFPPPSTESPNIVDAFVEAFVELNEQDNCVLVMPISVQ